MNLTSWALLVIGTFLVFWGFLKPEHQITPREAADLLESRKGYLPKLKENVINKIKRLEYIRDIASKWTLSEYIRKYCVESSKQLKEEYKKNPSFFTAARLDTRVGFNLGKAVYNNLYYEDLKKTDDAFNQLETEYDLLIGQVKDKKLRRKLNEYWDIEDKSNSRIICEQIIKNDKYPLSSRRRNWINIIEKLYARKLKRIPISRVIDRIDELLDGAADE